MECLFAPELSSETSHLSIIGEELKHIRALRLRLGENILLSNGNGLAAEAEMIGSNKISAEFRMIKFLPEFGELPFKLTLALGIMENRERMEFALEKAVELGITSFQPLKTKFSQKKNLNQSRFQAKIHAAMKQSQRSRLTEIHEPLTIPDFLDSFTTKSKIILADVEGNAPSEIINDNICVVVGSEGGFSPSEIALFSEDKRVQSWKLAGRRLRAETAAIVAVSSALNHIRK